MPNSEIELPLTLPRVIRVLMPSRQVEEMKLETYLAGAVAAEIGERVPLEALKAQAVASRTYVVAAQRHPEHQADVCTTAHCQKWQRVDPVKSPEVFRALSETWGKVAVYDGNLIQTFFFEHCNGHTRNAEEMLIPPKDYLRGVDCPCGHLTLKGHGVGMCKRGAVVMARRGATFAQILRHYYRGVSIGRMMVEPTVAPALEEVAPPRAPEAKKPRPRKIIRDKVNVPKHAKPTHSPQRSAPTTLPEIKPATPKRPVLKSVISESTPDDQPESIKPAAQPLLKRLPLGFLRGKRVEPDSSRDDSEQENFVVVAKAVAPIEPKPVEPASHNGDDGNEPIESEKVVIRIPRKKPAEAETATAPEEEPVEVAPTVVADQVSEPVVAPQPNEPAPSEESSHVEPAQDAPIPTADPVAVEPHVEIKPRVVAETDLPPLEGIEIKPTRKLHVDHLPGTRMIAGNLSRSGMVVVIENSHGNQTLVFTGTAPHYGEGGFETMVNEDGLYRVLIEGQTIEVKLQGETAFIHAG